MRICNKILCLCTAPVCSNRFVENTDNLQQNISKYKYITRKGGRITVTVRSKACLFGRSLAEIAGSNPAECYAYFPPVFAVCRVVSGLCYELIFV